MFEIITIDYYKSIYFIFLSVFVLLTCLWVYIGGNDKKSLFLSFLGVSFTLFFLFYVGFRPLNAIFTDMYNYAIIFDNLKHNNNTSISEVGFVSLIKLVQYIGGQSLFFFSICLIYIASTVLALRRWFKFNWPIALAFVCTQFFFYAYGTNTIRNGLASSVFMLGISYKGAVRYSIVLLSVSFHTSFLLPVGALFLFKFIKNIKYYFIGWLICLAISIAIPGAGDFLAGVITFDERLESYSSGSSDGDMKTGFRIDFLLFSMLPILIGAYFYFKRNYRDLIFAELLSIYLTANAFWLLMIRAAFSDRFAYLSWFLYGVVICYPFLMSNSIRHLNRYTSILLLSLFLFNLFFYLR